MGWGRGKADGGATLRGQAWGWRGGHLQGEDLLPGGSLTSRSPHSCPEKDRGIGGLRADSESEGP